MRPVWMSFINLKKIFSDVKQCRQAVHAMNTRFPEVGEEELARIDITCIICRDDMTRVGEPKKLPCGHVFHKNCLRNWFQHQRTCPTCRCNVLDENPPNRNQGPVNNNNNNNGNAQPNANNNNNNQFPNFFQNVFNNMGGNAQPPNNNNPVPPNQPNNPNNGNIPNMPPFNFANLPPLPPLFPSAHINVFPQPPNYAGMSEEELLTMELNTREAIVARIEALNNITTLLDAVRMQFEQYNALPVVVQNIQSRSPPPTTSSEEANTSGSTLRSTSSVIGETFNNSHGTSTRATGGLSNDNLNSSSGSAGTGVSSDMVFNSTADSPGSVPSVGVRDVLNDTQGSSGSNVQSAGGASGRLTSDLLNSNPGSPSIGRSDHLNSSQGSASIGRSDNLNSPQDSTGRSDLSNSTQDSTSTGRSDILKNSLSSNRNKSIDNPTDTAIANGTTSSIEHNESTSTAIAADQTPNPFESLSQMEAMRRRRIENLDKKTNSTEEGDNSH
uniref:RING-type E3 ubiquitin transferase n=1 Tax=Rhabditophanes sp. KR3021 TaxID=114890 RepID=A0AC35UCG1_9BILA